AFAWGVMGAQTRYTNKPFYPNGLVIGILTGGADTEGEEPRGAESEGVESGGAEPRGTVSAGGPAGASP
ncbi:unnamed protein product, partial [Closterium sp. NIES-54]